MNHARIYDSLIARARTRNPVGYVERHHVIPKALGGTDAGHNLVLLTGREHFLAHWLLARIHGGTMWLPLIQMRGRLNGHSRAYEEARKAVAAYQSGRPLPAATRAKMSATRRAKGFRHSEATKQRMRENLIPSGYTRSEADRAAISDRMKGNRNGVGRLLTPDGIERIRAGRIAWGQRNREAKRRAA